MSEPALKTLNLDVRNDKNHPSHHHIDPKPDTSWMVDMTKDEEDATDKILDYLISTGARPAPALTSPSPSSTDETPEPQVLEF
jgi:hypothetical protein